MTQWIKTDNLSDQDISSALEISSYTADKDRAILCQFFVDQIVGNGDYTFYMTLQIAGVGSTYIIAPKSVGIIEPGETAIGGQSIPINVRNGDIVKVYLDGLPGDTVTPDTTVRWFETSPWLVPTRTLTQVATSIIATVTGSSINIQRGDTANIPLTGLGDLTSYISLDFTVKIKRSSSDNDAILRIRKNLSGSEDGLLRLNGEAADPAADGSITIDDIDTGDITISLAAAATDDLETLINLYYDIQMITATTVYTLTEGNCDINADVTRAVS